MKAEDYICDWLQNKYGSGCKELGDWLTVEVISFADDFAEAKIKELSNDEDCEHLQAEITSLRCNTCLDCGKILDVLD